MIGLDVSNWDADRHLVVSDIEFLIAKCSEGCYYYDYSFESFIKSANDAGCLTGAYHFAGDSDPISEAEYFYNKVKYYLNICIPFLDFENFALDSISTRNWCESFIERFYQLSGVWCGLYISASLCSYFAGSWIPEKSILWVAGYPTDEPQYEAPAEFCPYDVNPWIRPSIWQFSSLFHFAGDVYDGNVSYITREIWLHKLPAESQPIEHTSEEYLHAACRVVLGEYGIGDTRKHMLEEQGYDYYRVQGIVNEIMGLM